MNKSTELLKQEDLDRLIQRIPKMEMHFHLEGAFRWATIREYHPDGSRLAPFPPWHFSGFRFSGFAEFLEVFQKFIRPATGTPETIERHTYEALADLAAQNVRYAEVIITPAFHSLKGLSYEKILEAIHAGKIHGESDHPIVTRFHLGLKRELPLKSQMDELEYAVEIAGPKSLGLISGIDLQGYEVAASIQSFAPLFQLAESKGLHIRTHAGELTGPHDVRGALDLGIRHLSHGIHAEEEPDLVNRIKALGVYLHCCPTSNVMLNIIESYESHPLKKLFREGCRVTINSDDPLLFGTNISEEYKLAYQKMGFTLPELLQFTRIALNGSRLETAGKEKIFEELASFEKELSGLHPEN